MDNLNEIINSEIDKCHYQNKEYAKNKLYDLLYELKNKGNLVEELIYAIETYLEK